MRDYYEDEEPEVDLISLDDLDEGDDMETYHRNPDWTGLTADFDGEALLDNLLSGECE